MVDWGGKVAAWFAGVAVASATLAALIAATARQPFHGWLRVVFIILVIIAGVSLVGLLLTGPRAAWAAWRNRKAAGRGPAHRPQSGDAVDDTINPAEPRSPDLQGLGERPKVSGGDVTSTISGGTQYGPVLQGRDFTGLTFGPGPATPGPDLGKDPDSQ